ncbi:MAG: hypothetical protein JSW47_11495 [Phycisphaerales bacterium]|nr:MAG: hypothetical protein JSW47_11495 [Phycisphaerales bacterium]
MKLFTNYPVRVLATGLVVLTLLSIPLFWMRFFCRLNLSEIMPDDTRNVSMESSGYISPEIEGDPNLAQHSKISARIDQDYFTCLGIFDYFISRYSMGRRSDVFVAKSEENWAYFDRPSGQIICRYNDVEVMPDGEKMYRQVQYYIGPDGISEIPDDALGRFFEPIIDSPWSDWGWAQRDLPDLILYDKKLARFFKIDFSRATVTKGPQISDGDLYDPIQIGWLDKNIFMLHLNWRAPRMDFSMVDDLPYFRYALSGVRYGGDMGDAIQSVQYNPTSPHLLVLDKSGRIDLLDKQTLQFVGTAGRLPEPRTLFGSHQAATPENTLSYSVRPLYLGKRLWPYDRENNEQPMFDPNSLKYAGMFAASLSHDGTGLTVTAFDEEGAMITEPFGSRTKSNRSEDVYFGGAGAPLCTLGKYLAEGLHPPILSIASCFTASAFEAGAGHRALFLLPNSFVAMNARENREGLAVKIVTALFLLLPPIILAAWLACRVTKDAAAVGLSNNLRCFWALLTLAFGLAGYITYRLIRPTITLVTCPNCGKGRRPDSDTCHHCTAKWEIPELMPPTWRVLDS